MPRKRKRLVRPLAFFLPSSLLFVFASFDDVVPRKSLPHPPANTSRVSSPRFVHLRVHVQLHRFQEFLVLVRGPVLPLFGDGVGLAHFLRPFRSGSFFSGIGHVRRSRFASTARSYVRHRQLCALPRRNTTRAKAARAAPSCWTAPHRLKSSFLRTNPERSRGGPRPRHERDRLKIYSLSRTARRRVVRGESRAGLAHHAPGTWTLLCGPRRIGGPFSPTDRNRSTSDGQDAQNDHVRDRTPTASSRPDGVSVRTVLLPREGNPCLGPKRLECPPHLFHARAAQTNRSGGHSKPGGNEMEDPCEKMKNQMIPWCTPLVFVRELHAMKGGHGRSYACRVHGAADSHTRRYCPDSGMKTRAELDIVTNRSSEKDFQDGIMQSRLQNMCSGGILHFSFQ